MCSYDAQAAQRAIAEMQRIPRPSPRGADTRLGEASEHDFASCSMTDSQLQENEDMARHQKEGMHQLVDRGEHHLQLQCASVRP